MYIRLCVKYPLLLSDLNGILFSRRILQNPEYRMSWKFVQLETDGRTDRNNESNSRLSQFCDRA
jgi:hypothetical protein